VEAGPKLSIDIEEVVIALDAVRYRELTVDGTVIGRLVNARNPGVYTIRCSCVGPNAILLKTFMDVPCVTTVEMALALADVPTVTLLAIKAGPTKPADANVLSPRTDITVPRWPRIVPAVVTSPPT